MVSHFFLLDVKDDVQLIDQHQEYQINVCPEIEKSIKELCIQKLKIYYGMTYKFYFLLFFLSFTFHF